MTPGCTAADEAHGTHFYFGENMPVSAMEAGADMAAVSIKSGGSLTPVQPAAHRPQDPRRPCAQDHQPDPDHLRQLPADVQPRHQPPQSGPPEGGYSRRVIAMAEYAREEINAIGGYYAFGRELVNGDSIFDFDPTKLSVHTRDIGLAGIEVYDLLRDESTISRSNSATSAISGPISIGDRYPGAGAAGERPGGDPPPLSN